MFIADRKPTEMSYQMQDLDARIVLVHPTLLDTARKAAKTANISHDRLYIFSDVEHKPVDGIRDWRSMLGTPKEASYYSWPRLSGAAASSQIATVNYSSGTTGLPKGVKITHSNLIANVEQSAFIANVERPGIKPDFEERWIGFLPLYHAYGQLSSILMAVKTETPVYVMTTFVYEDFLRVIQEHRITELQVAPPILVLLNKHPATSRYDLSSVSKISCGAAPLSASLQNHVQERTGAVIRQGWGMTELTCAGIVIPTGLSDETGSIGCLLPNSEAMLLDENGKEVATGERGELYVWGPNVSPGYWKNDKATKETMLEGGWLRTGDVAIANEKGWFWIVDRLKVRPHLRHLLYRNTNIYQELIKVSGLQVAPAELEALLLTHPSIADAGVVGISDAFSDTFSSQERPRAYVLPKSMDPANPGVSAEEVEEWVRGKVARHKWLSGGVVFSFVPKSAAGKIQRKVLREWARGDERKGTAKL
jgi:acyl-CoA synthetase (AMP-forming)/AMP-acid ligase II